jgi:hypothetical protein
MHFITPSPTDIERALEAWQWLPIGGKRVIRVTPFGDFFLADKDGIWFLDTIEGIVKPVCKTEDELDALLRNEDMQDEYLLGGFVERAEREGLLPGEGQCYTFKVHPMLGAAIAYDNIEVMSFVVAVNLVGQLLKQIRSMPDGTRISGVTITD